MFFQSFHYLCLVPNTQIKVHVYSYINDKIIDTRLILKVRIHVYKYHTKLNLLSFKVKNLKGLQESCTIIQLDIVQCPLIKRGKKNPNYFFNI